MTKEQRCAICTKTWDEHKTVISHDFKHGPRPSNLVAHRAREYREKRGHWGTHAEALCAEVERLHNIIKPPMQQDETAGDDARDAARYRYLRERLACDRLAARKLVITTEGGREPYRTLREAELDREIDECIGLSVERTPPHPGPSIERAFANSPRRVKEPEAVRAGVSVKDPTPPQDIILCAAMGPSGFICERPKGHPGRHCDGDNRSWSPEKASCRHVFDFVPFKGVVCTRCGVAATTETIPPNHSAHHWIKQGAGAICDGCGLIGGDPSSSSEKASAFKCVCGELHTLGDGHVCKSQKASDDLNCLICGKLWRSQHTDQERADCSAAL